LYHYLQGFREICVLAGKTAPEGGQQPNVNNGKNVQPLFNKEENGKRDVQKVLCFYSQNGPAQEKHAKRRKSRERDPLVNNGTER